MPAFTRASFVLLATGLLGFVYLNSAQAQPKPVDITTEWMEENTQVQYKELLKAVRGAPAAATANAADKLAGLGKIIAVSKPPKAGAAAAAKWKKYAEDLTKASEDASKAARANNPQAYKDAFRRLDDACNKCHTDFKP